MKKTYEKPAMRVELLQQQSHLLAGSDPEVHSIRGGYFDYGGSDEDYDGEVR